MYMGCNGAAAASPSTFHNQHSSADAEDGATTYTQYEEGNVQDLTLLRTVWET